MIIKEKFIWNNGEEIVVEHGKVARQADGSVWVQQGGTILIATVVAGRKSNPLLGFLPLTVDYREHFAAAGKIPGGFFKRDGKPNEYEILTSRLVDRALRPMFADGFTSEVQVLITMYSTDKEVMADSLACFAASCALMTSDIPFPQPVSAVRVIKIGDEFIVNPKQQLLEKAELDLIVAGTKESVVMVEGEMLEVSEETMLEAIKFAHKAISEMCEFQEKLREKAGKPTREFEKLSDNEELYNKVKSLVAEEISEVVKQHLPKKERRNRFDEIKEKLWQEFEDVELSEEERFLIETYFNKIKKDIVRKYVLEERTRIDGRKLDEVRPISIEVGLLPGPHGSALFTRGETQSLTTVTLGTKMDEQLIDYATEEGSKRFMLQYNFPPFSTGETKPLRGPSRREIGHGNLAERAIKNLIPKDNNHTIRVVSDILESNGSSSMATVCAASLALMDAGVQIKSGVSGIAMGLIVEEDKFAVLSDILGDEDHLGDMDFKVAGTKDGLTACQMDIKITGISFDILQKAVEQSKAGRLHILNKMNEVISEPRKELAPHAPKIVKIQIPSDKIGLVIGPGGKTIQELQKQTDTVITIEQDEDKAFANISGFDKDAIENAKKTLKAMVEPVEPGQIYDAKVVAIKDRGAIMELAPNKTAWLHISEISHDRVNNISDYLEVGKTYKVIVVSVDKQTNSVKVSIKSLLPKNESKPKVIRKSYNPKK